MPKIKLYIFSKELVAKHLQHTAGQNGLEKCLEASYKTWLSTWRLKKWMSQVCLSSFHLGEQIDTVSITEIQPKSRI